MSEFSGLTLAKARHHLRKRNICAKELTRALISAAYEGEALNAFVLETPELAEEMARRADEDIQRGNFGPLTGLPIGVKDMFATKDVRTTACSRILYNFVPTYESTVTANLWRDGAVLLGKLNCDEFAMGSSNETSCFGPVVSPWRMRGSDVKLVPGGSSGGSAAAVAAQLCMAATGTDTGGSIRQPAAFTGIVGIKPTYGRCSRWGIVAFASSLDQAGPMTKTVEDAAILLGSMAGHDPKDTTSVDLPVPDYEAATKRSVRGMTIGVPIEYVRPGTASEYWIPGAQPDIADLLNRGASWLQDGGVKIVSVPMPHIMTALAAYYIVAPAEASSNLARYDGVRYGLRMSGRDISDMYEETRAAGFGKEVKRRIMLGTYVLSAGYYDEYYLQAQKVRTLVTQDFDQAFNQLGCDAILTPTTPSAAFPIGEHSAADPIQMYLNDIFTVTVNMAGLPAISVPAGLNRDGLPLGLQLIGRPFNEEKLFALAAVIERTAGRFVPEKWWGR
jgi:aspartyl-tRNA(Asn)/glutamyl-tRNA(Gln) amidotransferase subunit A